MAYELHSMESIYMICSSLHDEYSLPQTKRSIHKFLNLNIIYLTLLFNYPLAH